MLKLKWNKKTSTFGKMQFLPIIPMSTTKNLKIIHKQTQEDSGKWRGEGRLAWDLGIQGITQQ